MKNEKIKLQTFANECRSSSSSLLLSTIRPCTEHENDLQYTKTMNDRLLPLAHCVCLFRQTIRSTLKSNHFNELYLNKFMYFYVKIPINFWELRNSHSPPAHVSQFTVLTLSRWWRRHSLSVVIAFSSYRQASRRHTHTFTHQNTIWGSLLRPFLPKTHFVFMCFALCMYIFFLFAREYLLTTTKAPSSSSAVAFFFFFQMYFIVSTLYTVYVSATTKTASTNLMCLHSTPLRSGDGELSEAEGVY